MRPHRLVSLLDGRGREKEPRNGGGGERWREKKGRREERGGGKEGREEEEEEERFSDGLECEYQKLTSSCHKVTVLPAHCVGPRGKEKAMPSTLPFTSLAT